MEISQLLLDVHSKTNKLSKTSPIFQAANQGPSAGTVLDSLLDHIGNVENWTAVSVHFLIQL